MRRSRNDKTPEVKGRWLLTFNDMMTLLFSFFVLIISMSRLDATKVRAVADSARKVIGPAEVPGGSKINAIESVISSSDRKLAQTGGRYIPGGLEDRKRALRQSLLSVDGVTVLPRKDGWAVMMSEPLLFLPGSAELTGKGQHVLGGLGKILQRTDVEIRVEGHTDDLLPEQGKYPSNWELSLARAVNAVQYLIVRDGIAPKRLSAVGYADKKPLAGDLTALSRKINRRVELILRFAEN